MTSRLAYQLLYRLGFAPWDRDHVPAELIALAEGPDALMPGKALDIGCGTGTQAVYLAKRGWQVTGIDIVDRALDVARRRARAEGVDVRWIRADVSDLTGRDLEPGYTLLYDIGCFHSLPEPARDGYARGVTALAAPAATLLIMGFAPGWRGPAPRGVDREELTRRFGGDWELTWVRPDTGPPLPWLLRNVQPTWYHLQRKA